MDPDSTPFFIDFKDAKMKNINFFIFFLMTFPQAHHLQSKKIYFLLKFCVKFYFAGIFFQSAQHIYEKREGSGAGSGSAPLTNGSGFGKPNTGFFADLQKNYGWS
jgi:hypothetical protein